MLKRLARYGTFAAALTSAACQRERSQATPSGASAAPDPNADGRRLAEALSAARTRISSLPAAPDCRPLLSETEAKTSCQPARDALVALKSRFERAAPEAEILASTAETLLAAERALKALRRAGVAQWFEKPASVASSHASALPSTSQKPASSPSSKHMHQHAPSRFHQGAHQQTLDAYVHIEALARRTLSAYLQFGPLGLRQRAFSELERLCRQEPHAPRLRDLAREAALVEANPELRRKLIALRERLGPG